jgi:hypothetical protein
LGNDAVTILVEQTVQATGATYVILAERPPVKVATTRWLMASDVPETLKLTEVWPDVTLIVVRLAPLSVTVNVPVVTLLRLTVLVVV